MSDASTGKKKILIIDDEPHIVTYLETLLADNGYDTVAASNGKECPAGYSNRRLRGDSNDRRPLRG